MRLEVSKNYKLEKILEELDRREMTRKEMAEFLGISYKNFCKYITQLVKDKKVYISGYRMTNTKWHVMYRKGNKPNAPKPKVAPYYQRTKELREQKKKALVSCKVNPRPDTASAWLFNPIC